MVLALANLSGGFFTNAITPMTINYVIECFRDHASESAAVMGLYRVQPYNTFLRSAWIETVGFGWCLGMGTPLPVLAYRGSIQLMWRVKAFRELSFTSIS